MNPPAPDVEPLLNRHAPHIGQARSWFMDHVPLFQCPDPLFERLWYYRWSVVYRHLHKVSAEVGYVITEFTSDTPLAWAGVYNTIVAASDHHINETRWLRSACFARDHLRLLLTHPQAQPRNYSVALADSVWALYIVHGDQAFATGLLDALIDNHHGWRRGRVAYPHDSGYKPKVGLFWNTGRDSTGEYNLPSAQLNEPLRGIQGYKIRGGAGYRPDNNSDMYADALAISRIARLAGREDEAQHFADVADVLKQRVQELLWDSSREFFMHRWRYDEYSEGDRHGRPTIRANSLIWQTNGDRFGGVGHQPHEVGQGRGRELIGYLPWYRMLPDDSHVYAGAWRFLLDPDYFQAPYGPTTAEKHDPWFSVQYDCRTNGNSFPLNTSRVLNAAANLLHEYQHHGPLTCEDYMDLLTTYARTQQKDSQPYLAEFHHPYKDAWVVDRPMSEHYFHSSFCDLVITGLLGIRPRTDGTMTIAPLIGDLWDHWAIRGLPFRGQSLDVLYDRDNACYGAGRGLSVWHRGVCVARAATSRSLPITLAIDQQRIIAEGTTHHAPS